MTLLERFLGKVVVHRDGCRTLSYKKSQKGGHTLMKVDRKQKLAHRVSWELFVGPIGEGLQVNHKCRNPKCVNIRHLYLGTQKENIGDAIREGTFPWRNLKVRWPAGKCSGPEN